MAVTNLETLIQEKERAREAKIRNLLALWRDPELASVVALLKNGHSHEAPANEGYRSIRGAIIALAGRLPQRFTARDALTVLKEAGFQSKAKDQVGAVRDALYTLHNKENKIKIVKKAEGESPNIYEWIHP
jgi:hypothetical protein